MNKIVISLFVFFMNRIRFTYLLYTVCTINFKTFVLKLHHLVLKTLRNMQSIGKVMKTKKKYKYTNIPIILTRNYSP